MSKVWHITGSSRGLGRALAEATLAAGDQVVATARNPAQIVDLKNRYGDSVQTPALDVTNEKQALHAVHSAIDTYGRLDVLVNNAGYGNVSPVEDTALDEFRAQIETNLLGVIIMTKAVLPYFRERRAGHIIQVTSIGGRIRPVGRTPYAAAKFGVEGFSESLSQEVGPPGVKVTIIEPGGFRTDFAGAFDRAARRPCGVRCHGRRGSTLPAGLRRQAAGRSGTSGRGASAVSLNARATIAVVARRCFRDGRAERSPEA
jgi:NAD(P)-dependent dehydrogenase (short-subunit alcohol dehydrogenase family)